MRYNQPQKHESDFISDKISITSISDFYKISANSDIVKGNILIIEFSKINLFGLENINRELQVLKLYVENKHLDFIKELYPRTSNFLKTNLIKNIHSIIRSIKTKNSKLYHFLNSIDKDTIELLFAKYIFNAFEGFDFGPITLPMISKINHSCTPNVKFKFNRDTGSMHLIAIKDIKKGNELFASYLENKKIESHQEYLLNHYGITGYCCRCI